MFQVVEVTTGVVIEQYPDGATAGAAAQRINDARRSAGDETRVRVVRVSAPADEPTRRIWGGPVPIWWQSEDCPYSPQEIRERYSFDRYADVPASGADWRRRESYKVRSIPWGDCVWWLESEYWAVHYPYPSSEKLGMLCYTPDEEAGRADRQTRTTAGRYLRRFFSDILSEQQIQSYALEWDNLYAPRALQFARTPDEIEDVYVNGPRSCMSHDADYYESPMHPCRIYGAGDLSVAYITDHTGDITARAIVWEKRRVYGRVYGDCERLEYALKQAGFEPGTAGSFDGARLLRIEYDRTFVAPYMDYPLDRIEDDGDYLRVSMYGPMECLNTSGLVDDHTEVCCACGDGYDEDELQHVSGYGMYCNDCYYDRFSACDSCDEAVCRDDLLRGPDDMYRCPSCHSHDVVECDDCGDEVLRTDIIRGPDDNERCESCHTDAVDVCDACSDEVMRDELDEYARCPECAEDPAPDTIPFRIGPTSNDPAQITLPIG